jgi:PKD repeat protein
MKRIKEMFLSRKETKRAEIILGVLLTLALLLQPCLAVLTPNYIAMTQVGRPLDSPGVCGLGDTLAYGDFLFLNDTTWTPGSVGETIASWKWNLTNLSDPTDSVVKNERNVSFGPFIKDGNSYLLNLTVTASDANKYSPTDMVYQVSDNRVFVSANYSTVPAYDNRTLLNPNGTITFWDESYSILDPMSYISDWWWRWTDLTTGVTKTLSGQDHFTEDMTDTEIMVNLTVRTSQGNLVSVTDITPIPPDDVYPIANFSVIPKSCVAPLEIGITDQALSMVNYTVSDVPLSYNYTIWNAADVNVFGTEFTTKNLNVTLPDPGVYHVIQNVTNSFGVSDEYTVGDIVVALPDGPIVNFSASVREGLAPLNVTLIDQTTGVKPFTYRWIIGNGTWASQPKTNDNPQFNLTYSGKYWVNLTVTDKNGRFNTLKRDDFITVGPQKYPIAAFTAVPMKGTYPLNVSFIDQSVLDPDLLATGVPVRYHWTFDDGGEEFIKNPTHIFTKKGDYNVTLYVSHGDLPGSVQSTSKYINVYEPSDSGINFTWVQEYGKTAYSAVLIPLGITADWTVNWIVEKDGVPYYPVDPLAFTPRYDLPETGVYTVTMTASRPDGYTTGAKTQQMEIFPNVPPSPEITMESPFDSGKYWAYAFAGDSIQFWSNASNSMEDSWYWDFGDTYTSNLRSPVHSYNAPGLYTVTLKASNVKGETSADINQLPYIPYGVVDMYNVWILNDVVVIPSADPTSGTMPLKVKFDAQVSINGKSDTESRKYIDKWYWDFDVYSTQGSSIEESPTYTYNEPGTFYPGVWVQLINDYWYWRGPWSVDTITVSPDPLITCSFTEEEIDRIGTYGYSYKFMDTSKSYVSSIVSWDWDFGDGSPNSTEPAPTHLFKELGIYTVTLTVMDGAYNSDTYSKSIAVGAGSTGISASFTTDVDGGLAPLGVQFFDTSSGNPISYNPISYHWDFDDGITSTEKDPYHVFSSIGTYHVFLTITGNTGDISQVSKDIRVVDKNIISRFIAEFPNYPNLRVVQFYDQSNAPAGITTWNWKFGDGGTANTKDPLYTYSGSGSFKPTLTVSNGYWSNTSSKEFYI